MRKLLDPFKEIEKFERKVEAKLRKKPKKSQSKKRGDPYEKTLAR